MHRVHKEQTNIPIPWSITVTLPESDKGSVQASSKLLTSKLNCSITSSDGNVLASNCRRRLKTPVSTGEF